MIKLETLTTQELEYICSQIPPSISRKYFQKYPKSFLEIKPGFRPEKLSDADTFSFLIKNSNKPFVASFLESTVSKWLFEIQENRNRLENEGYSEEEALLLTVPDSYFCDNCALYFKLIEQDPNEEYIRLFREALSLRQKEEDARKSVTQTEKEQKDEGLLQEANNTIADLKEQLKESKEKAEGLSEELNLANSRLMENKEEIEVLKSALQDSDVVRSEMQVELEHYRRLASFSDEYVQVDDSDFQHSSIGQIYHDYNGQPWINRLADIVNGEIVPFVLDDNAPRYFDNRDRLFWKDGPDKEETIGIWNWRADPSFSDSTKDYVTSEYNRYMKVTEVIELPQCKSLSEVSSFLTDWFEKDFTAGKILFVYPAAGGEMEGVLCSTEDLEFYGGQVRLLASVFMLPHYTIKHSDIIRIGGIRIYRKMSLGIPQSVYRVKTPYDVVKKMLLSRVTIPALRENELTKKEAQKCKHFLEGIPTETLVQDVSDAYACTETEAKAYIDGFIEHAASYLSSNDLDLNIISLSLARNSELVEVCKKLLTEEWEKDYSEKLAEAQKTLAQAKQDEELIHKETEELLQKKNAFEGDIQIVRQEIEDANKLAEEVEKKVEERIIAAQQDAAEFISQMAFFTPFVNSSKPFEVSHGQNLPSIFKSTMAYTDEGLVDDLDTFEEELIDNFVLIGYSDEFATEMAQVISFCICSRLPILIGANSTVLAQCIAATIGGEELTEVYVGNQSTVISSLNELMYRNRAEHPKVYLIHGVFDGYSTNLFNEISNLLHGLTTNEVVILSLQGISPNMIFNSVWSSAFYIDGDSGLERIPGGSVHAVNPVMKFTREIDGEEYKSRRRELQPLSSVLSNMQLCRYARYLAFYGVDLQDSPAILSQIIAVSRSSGSEERLNALFHENGISNGEKMIDRFL